MIAFIKKIVIILGISVVLSACSLFGPSEKAAPIEYLVDAVPQDVVKKHARRIFLYVAQPEASTIFSTSQMAYKVKPHEINYFSKNRWAATPSQMLQPLMVETLQKTHHFRAVSGSTSGSFEYMLTTQIIDFQQSFYTKSSVATVTLRAQIIKTSTNEIVATKEFSATELAPQYTPYGGVVATNRATAKILAEMAKWCVAHTR